MVLSYSCTALYTIQPLQSPSALLLDRHSAGSRRTIHAPWRHPVTLATFEAEQFPRKGGAGGKYDRLYHRERQALEDSKALKPGPRIQKCNTAAHNSFGIVV